MVERTMQRRDFLGSGLAAAGLSLGAMSSVQPVEAAPNKNPLKVLVGMNLLLWTANPSEEHLKLLEDINRWGFDGAEFPMFSPKSDDPTWAKLGRHCEELGLSRTVSCCVPKDANPVSADNEVRSKAVDYLKSAVDCSHALGASMICGPFYAPVGLLVGRGRDEIEFNRAVEVIREVCEYAAQAKIELAHEPINRFETYVFNTQADGCKLVDAVNMPNFGLHYDTFHAHIEEKDSIQAIREAGTRIHHIHISENDRSTPGAGQVRWTETFAELKKIGYNRWLTIEAFGRAMPEVAAATCIWRSMFESEEQLAKDGLAFIRNNWFG